MSRSLREFKNITGHNDFDDRMLKMEIMSKLVTKLRTLSTIGRACRKSGESYISCDVGDIKLVEICCPTLM